MWLSLWGMSMWDAGQFIQNNKERALEWACKITLNPAVGSLNQNEDAFILDLFNSFLFHLIHFRP